jgi:hypothetical protein
MLYAMDDPHSEVLTIKAMNGQYVIESSPKRSDPWPAPFDALTTGEGNWIAVLTGTEFGPVEIGVAIAGEFPGWEPGQKAWDMVGERDLAVEHGEVLIHDLLSDTPPCRLRLGHRRYRLRIHVRGRTEAAPYGYLAEVLERHHILFFPTDEVRPPATLKGPDEWARNYR